MPDDRSAGDDYYICNCDSSSSGGFFRTVGIVTVTLVVIAVAALLAFGVMKQISNDDADCCECVLCFVWDDANY